MFYNVSTQLEQLLINYVKIKQTNFAPFLTSQHVTQAVNFTSYVTFSFQCCSSLPC